MTVTFICRNVLIYIVLHPQPNSIFMKLLVALIVVFSSLTLSAKSLSVSAVDFSTSTETTISSQIDKKKQRKNKRMNKRRKKACSNWAKRSYAG